jgi:hypothetical protein
MGGWIWITFQNRHELSYQSSNVILGLLLTFVFQLGNYIKINLLFPRRDSSLGMRLRYMKVIF